MGLLGTSWDDPKTAAIMQFAGGLMSSPNAGIGLTKGIQGYQQAMNDSEERKWTKQEREFLLRERQRKEEDASLTRGLLSNIFGPQQSAQAKAGDAYMPGSPDAGQASPGGLAGATPEQIAMLKMRGTDLQSLWEKAKTGLPLDAGKWYKNPLTNQNEYIADPTKGVGVSGGQVVGLPGYAQANAAIKGAETEAVEGAKARFTLLPQNFVDESTGAPIGGSVGSYLQGQQPAPRQTQPQIAGFTGLSQQDQAAILADAQKNGITNPTISPNWNYGGQSQPAPQQPPRLQSTAQAKAADAQATLPAQAQGEINTTWLKSSFQPTVDGGSAASQVLTNVAVAKSALGNIGQTGWGTEAKATAASVLAGLGVAPESAKMFAANVQTFQNVAMTNLKTQLDAAAGPQTEGDAERASKLFASLNNSPQANAFILDVMEAKAQRDAAKAKFYQGALPIAQRSGDLSIVDREWSNRAPSVFDMPSMKKWNIK